MTLEEITRQLHNEEFARANGLPQLVIKRYHDGIAYVEFRSEAMDPTAKKIFENKKFKDRIAQALCSVKYEYQGAYYKVTDRVTFDCQTESVEYYVHKVLAVYLNFIQQERTKSKAVS